MSQTYTVTVHPDRTEWCKPNTNTLHRLDGPAVEFSDGHKHWWMNGKRHRLDGPAVEYKDGGKAWWVEDKRHRLDGPAVEWIDGTKFWYKEGKFHRTDGPAVEYTNGTKYWYIEGKQLTEAEFLALTQPKVEPASCDGKTIEIDGKKYVLKLVH